MSIVTVMVVHGYLFRRCLFHFSIVRALSLTSSFAAVSHVPPSHQSIGRYRPNWHHQSMLPWLTSAHEYRSRRLATYLLACYRVVFYIVVQPTHLSDIESDTDVLYCIVLYRRYQHDVIPCAFTTYWSGTHHMRQFVPQLHKHHYLCPSVD